MRLLALRTAIPGFSVNIVSVRGFSCTFDGSNVKKNRMMKLAALSHKSRASKMGLEGFNLFD